MKRLFHRSRHPKSDGTTIVARYQQIEALYLARPDTTLKQEFERRLISLYKHIIRYQILATCYYRRNTMG